METDSTYQDHSYNTNSSADLARVADSDLSMEQTNAPDDSESVSVSISSVTLRNLEKSTEDRERVSR
eukprot:9491685-Pyramimonas_sp.AAC.1